MWFIFFDIFWLIICDIGICFIFEWLFVMQLLINSKFYIQNIYFFCFFINFFFILIKSNKHVDTTGPFNKWVGLGLRNLNPFNKHVGLVLTYVVKYSWLDTTQTRHVNTNCHPYALGALHGQRLGRTRISTISLPKFNFLPPLTHCTFSCNFSNIVTEIQYLFSFCQITLNNTYNTNKLPFLQYLSKRLTGGSLHRPMRVLLGLE